MQTRTPAPTPATPIETDFNRAEENCAEPKIERHLPSYGFTMARSSSIVSQGRLAWIIRWQFAQTNTRSATVVLRDVEADNGCV